MADPHQVEVNQAAVWLISEEAAQEYLVLPLSLDRDGTLRVLMEDPADFDVINRLAQLTGCLITPVFALGEGLEKLIQESYSPGAVAKAAKHAAFVIEDLKGFLLEFAQGNPNPRAGLSQAGADAAIDYLITMGLIERGYFLTAFGSKTLEVL